MSEPAAEEAAPAEAPAPAEGGEAPAPDAAPAEGDAPPAEGGEGIAPPEDGGEGGEVAEGEGGEEAAEGEGEEGEAEEEEEKPPPELTELEILERITPLDFEVEGINTDGLKGFFLNSENFMKYELLVQQAKDEDIFFSGSQTKPFKVFDKKACIEEVKKLGFYSDFHGALKELEKSPLTELLLMRDQDRVFGENFVWAHTKDSFEYWTNRLEELQQAVKDEYEESLKKPAKKQVVGEDGEIVEEEEEEPVILEEDDVFVKDEPITPREWCSDTMGQTSDDVRLFAVLDTRPLIKNQIQRKRLFFGQPIKFNDAPENIHLCRPQKDPNFALQRRELEKGIQAVCEYETVSTQTTWYKPQNAIIQYSADDFIKSEPEDASKENAALQKFLNNVMKPMQEALQQNETIDIFKDEFSNLGEEDFGFGSKANVNIKEHRNFHDVTYTKGKRIEWVEWVPGSPSMLACSCCEAAPFSERYENSGKAEISFLLLWSFLDSLAPQTVLISPWDVSVFKFYPGDATIIVGGLANGQIAIWQLSHSDLTGESRERKNQGGQISRVPHKMLSFIDDGHKKAISAILWLPPCLEIERKGKTVMKKGAEKDAYRYFLTISGDGQVIIWDFLQAKEAMSEPDFQWKPCHRVQLQRQDSGTEMGLCQVLYQLPKEDTEEDENEKKKKAAPVYTNFSASTEEGEVIYGDWAAKAEDDRKPEFCKKMLTVSKTFRPMYCLQRSPFFPDIILGVTDWGFYLWKETEKEHIYASPTGQSYFTCGSWSPTRPSVIFLGRLDGGIDVWDFSDQSHKPSVFHPVTSAALSSLVFVPNATDPAAASQLAVGDEQGHVHVLLLPKNLVKASKKELTLMQRFIDREVVRITYFEKRKEELLEENPEEVEKEDSDSGKEETALEAKYLEFQKWCQENLK